MKTVAAVFITLFAVADLKAQCASCHRTQVATQPKTSMGRALESAAECDILRQHPELTFRDEPYVYRLVRQGDKTLYSVTDGKETIEAPIAWAFGLGAAGQTYVFERSGTWFESRVSYFRSIDRLDLTLGARSTKPSNLEEAAGRAMNSKDATECFNCHATGAISRGQLDASHLQAGVLCERCHGSAETHLGSFRSGHPSLGGMRKLSSLTTEDLSVFCGQCHRTWAQIASDGPFGINNVRFQPYRLTNSRCYDPADKRIACTACHDPHADVARAASLYDARCQACHAAGRHASAKICPVGKSDCSSCHMPKLELPGSHNKFTDHQIRIVKANEKYPN